MNIAVCIATYKRPEGLKALLASLSKLAYDPAKIFVFIADNDSQGKAGHAYVEANKQNFPFYIESDVEPGAGVSFARNKSLTMARNSGKNFDTVAFMDDDTEVAPDWATHMTNTMNRYNADAVVGIIEPQFPQDAPQEIITSAFFADFRCGPTGAKLDDGWTGNALVKRNVFDDLGYCPFDTKLSLVGGEDSDFFKRIYKKNYKIIQCNEAVITEFFPLSRLNEEWIGNRYFRIGSTYAYILSKYGTKAEFAFMLVKKIIKYMTLKALYAFSPNLTIKCRLKDTEGFLYFAINKKPFEEYKRNA